jgi:hypothetical protein
VVLKAFHVRSAWYLHKTWGPFLTHTGPKFYNFIRPRPRFVWPFPARTRSLSSDVIHTTPKDDFILFQPKWSPVCLEPPVTIVRFNTFPLINKSQQSLSELFNDALKTSEITLAFEERYKGIGYQVCKTLSIFCRGSYKNFRENQVGWVYFQNRTL